MTPPGQRADPTTKHSPATSLTTLPLPSADPPVGRETLCLLSGPYVMRDGRRLNVPEGSKRLLAFVALHSGRVHRWQTAGTLWPDGSDERAAGNLRSAVAIRRIVDAVERP